MAADRNAEQAIDHRWEIAVGDSITVTTQMGVFTGKVSGLYPEGISLRQSPMTLSFLPTWSVIRVEGAAR